MVWVTWRQHRAQVLVTAGFLAALWVLLLVHGQAAAGQSGEELRASFQSLYTYLSWLPVVPLLVGLFWGAPLLARELERGTHRLAWTQSVSRRRWLTTKLGVLGGAVTVSGLALGAMVSAWVGVFDGVASADRFGDAALFGATGVAAGAWWLFAFALGTAAGGLVRRTLPAFALTIAVFIAVMVAAFMVREDYAEPVRVVAEGPIQGTYLTGSASLSPAGVEVPGDALVPECASEGRTTYLDCVDQAGYQSVLYYQPADRYWRFQWTEAGLLVLLSVLLAGPVLYRLARRPV
ncbi:ABC transporter permease [Actinophytocola glycyrrhizae]|uniref:ABC transporter permease n=1 Tax=Actinophytocola glycyrrhizae TaxID=2044873 RepID=A0ABV9SB96_9PSEU